MRSTKAGLVAIFLVSLTFVTFGPSFNLALAYGLMVASMVAALLGIGWADHASHEARRKPALSNGIYAKSGAALSVVALLVSAYYTGLVFVIVFLWPAWLIIFLLLYTFHRASVDAKAGSGAGF